MIGDGELMGEVRKRAGSTIEVKGRQSESVIREHLAGCRALLFPGVEDFGIVPVEAMASGRPVVALGCGGAVETVVDGATGVLYGECGVDGLIDGVKRFVEIEADFAPAKIRQHAARFGKPRFVREFGALVRSVTAANVEAASARNEPAQ